MTSPAGRATSQQPPTAPRTPPIGPIAHYWADEASRQRFVRDLFDRTAPEYDHVEALLAFGTGRRYRHDALRRAGLRPGMAVLDIATGTGLVAREASALVGDAGLVVGLDPSAGMLDRARDVPASLLVRSYGERLPFRDACFDFVTMGFALRHVSDLGLLFREIRRVLRPGGTACILEISRPRSRFASAALQAFMTRLAPLLAGGARRRAEARTLMQFYWDTIDACVSPGDVLLALEAAGFPAPRRGVTLGIFSEYLAARGNGS